MPKLTLVPGTIQFNIQRRVSSIENSLQHWDDILTKKDEQPLPQIISPAQTERDGALLNKLTTAPASEPKDKKSAVTILIHDPVTGNYCKKSLDKKYLKTLQAFDCFGRKDSVVYYSQHYDPALAGKATAYSTLFADTRALLTGKRKIFANTRAFIDGTGSLFADTRALLSGNRPLFASVRRSLGKISSEDISKSALGVERKPTIT